MEDFLGFAGLIHVSVDLLLQAVELSAGAMENSEPSVSSSNRLSETSLTSQWKHQKKINPTFQ